MTREKQVLDDGECAAECLSQVSAFLCKVVQKNKYAQSVLYMHTHHRSLAVRVVHGAEIPHETLKLVHIIIWTKKRDLSRGSSRFVDAIYAMALWAAAFIQQNL